MTNNRLTWIVPAVAAAIAGFWLWQAFEDPVQVLIASGLALTALVVAIWQYRFQAARRWRTALDVYAERTLARERRRANERHRQPPRPAAARVA